MHISLPQQIDHYRLEEPLGRPGLHGRVGKYRDDFTDRHVAIKVLSDSGAAQQVWSEAEALAALNSEHLVQLLHAHEMPGGGRALVMTYVEGCDLTDIIANGPPDTDVTFRLLCQLYQAVDMLHAQAGLIHGDLKPANIRVASPHLAKPEPTQADEVSHSPADLPSPSWRLVVLDLGLSVKAGRSPVRAGGTPPYRAPEQATNVPWERSLDWWAFGLIAAELITGVDAQAAYRDATADASRIAATRAARDRLLEEMDRVPHMGLHELVRGLLFDNPTERPDADKLRSVFGLAPPSDGDGSPPIAKQTELAGESRKPWFRRSSRNVLVAVGSVFAASLAVALAVGWRPFSSGSDAEIGRTTRDRADSVKEKALPIPSGKRPPVSRARDHQRRSRSRSRRHPSRSAKGVPASPARESQDKSRSAGKPNAPARGDSERPAPGVRNNGKAAPPGIRPPAIGRANRIRFTDGGVLTATVKSRNQNALFRHDFGLRSPEARKGCRACSPGNVIDLGEVPAGTVTFYLDATPPVGSRFGEPARFLSTDREHARITQMDDHHYRIAWEDYNDANFIDLVVDVRLKRG